MFFPRNFFGKCVSKYVIRDKKGRRGGIKETWVREEKFS
jgi:hypothetical protein